MVTSLAGETGGQQFHTCWIEPLRRYHRCCPYPDSERDAHVWLAAASLETPQSCCFADRQQAILLY